MNRQWRLILDGDNGGYYNMAVDEAVFRCYPGQKIPTLRIYGWQPACISIGYNQDPRDILKKNQPFGVVRRITGGAAILHGREITYGMACAASDLDLPFKVKDSYRLICSFLIKFYASLGLKSAFACDVSGDQLGNYQGFCFSRREHYDLVVGNKKIGGNAQRRNRKVIFQHGSIPLKIDYDIVNSAIKGAGALQSKTISLEDILGPQDVFVLRRRLAESFSETFGVELIESALNLRERSFAKDLVKNKYKTDEWNIYKDAAEKPVFVEPVKCGVKGQGYAQTLLAE